MITVVGTSNFTANDSSTQSPSVLTVYWFGNRHEDSRGPGSKDILLLDRQYKKGLDATAEQHILLDQSFQCLSLFLFVTNWRALLTHKDPDDVNCSFSTIERSQTLSAEYLRDEICNATVLQV